MIHFTLSGVHDDPTVMKTTVDFKAEGLQDVVQNIEFFLKGLGYSFHNLEINMDDPYVVTEYNQEQNVKWTDD